MQRVAVLLAVVAAAAAVQVQRLPAFYEQDVRLTIDKTIEYILEFTPTVEQASWPARVRLQATATDPARPVLVTARQRTGAETWQLPARARGGGGVLLQQLQRTLCFNYTEGGGGGGGAPFSLHVSSGGEEPVHVTARADPGRDVILYLDDPATVTVTQTAAGVYYFRFGEQDSVRLLLQADDDVCATLAVHNYTCPTPETVEAVRRGGGGLRMTVQRSGGAHVARSQFPEGFYVLVVVHDTDEECSGSSTTPAPQENWLWGAAVGAPDRPTQGGASVDRSKTVTLTVQPALSRAAYAAAAGATLALFLVFYAGFLALLVAQRYQPVKRLIAPRAVLAETNTGEERDEVDVVRRRRRRGSNETFDSVDDDSESDEEQARQQDSQAGSQPVTQSDSQQASAAGNGGSGPAAPHDSIDAAQNVAAPVATTGDTQAQPPFGLPPRLHVAALSRRRDVTLRARSDRYLHTLYIVAVFYALPVLQFVVAFQIVLNVSGSLDLCYYNFLCAHPLGRLSDFNHVLSNLGYLLLGALLMLTVRRRRARRRRRPRDEEYGIPAHYGLLTALGAGMMVVALLSASYHVCPNRLNFQFDTAFMYVLGVLCTVKLYQARHPDINARAHSTFGVLAVLIALVVWGVVGGGAVFWATFTVLHVSAVLLLSLRVYYLGQFTLDGSGLAEAARGLRSRPLYVPRLVLLGTANALNWAIALYGLLRMPADFAGHLLQVILGNALLYLVFYVTMKLLHGERPRWYAWCFLASAAAAWLPALYFFVSGSSDWAATPALSRHRNHECRVLRFYDSHDLWHFLSAVALYLTFTTLLTLDDGLSAVKRTEIAVF